nr:NADH dehydrogenase subunit 2 [Lymnaea stagnalis]
MNYMYLIFLFFLILGPVMSISCSSWILCWAGLELGFFALMPLLLSGNYSLSKEVVLKYFSVQALSSVLLFFSGSFLFGISSFSAFIYLIFLFSLSLKLGFFPGHFWVPSVICGLDWISCCLILGPLKIAPLAFLVNFLGIFSTYEMSVLLLGVISAILGSLLGNNQTNIRAMIGSSSISHTGWMLVASVLSQLWSYFLIYLLVLYGFFFMMMKMDMMSSGFMLLSFSGLPPFIMFTVKMNIIFELAVKSFSAVFIMLILSSLFSLYFYLKFSYSLMLNSKNSPSFLYYSIFLFMNMFGCLFIYL